MRERLKRKLEALESERRRIEALVGSVPADRARLQPAPGKWSAVQIVVHLATAEYSSLKYIRKKIQTPDAVPPAGAMSALRTLALVVALGSPFRFKAPEVISAEPDNPEPEEALKAWSGVRVELRELLESLPEDVMGRALFKHPVAGRMNMSQTIDFMMAHMKRHGRQMQGILTG